jgi:hypothetical protein
LAEQNLLFFEIFGVELEVIIHLLRLFHERIHAIELLAFAVVMEIEVFVS